jgi:hypothetical protein
MPITYSLLTPLALFTLDNASWETRGHEQTADPDAVPDPMRDVVLTEGEPTVARARARSHAQLPAA